MTESLEAIKWQRVASQGIQVERKLRLEIERLRADNERLEELVKLEQSSQYAENAKLRAALAALYEDCRDGPASNQSMKQARAALEETK